ncbi:transcription factor GTE8-like [Oryza brachyantha]|uniref:transcription factor GTE8-like n=1 Tax=Oryza brachyantha TaxID=4533 RepID=UPI001ADD3C0D|nr:transcription factor GTE8-like [Oryza brachyantha]
MAVGRVPPPPAPAHPGLPGRRRLRERVQSERRAVGALVKKAEALLAGRRDVRGGAAAGAEAKSGACGLLPRGKKSGRFLNPEAATAAEADGDASATKRRKTIVTSPGVEVEMEVIEPKMSRADRERLYSLIASLSADLPWPPHIVELMQTECCCAVDPNGDKMEINLNSAKDATLFRLLNLLEEFAQQSKIQPRAEDQEPTKIQDCVSRSTLCQLEDGEIADEDADMEIIDVCSGISPLVVEQEEDGFSRGASPVAVDKFPEPSRSNCSPSGSSCRVSSSSSGRESDDDSERSSDEAEAKPLEVEQQVVPEIEMQEVAEQDTGVEPKPLEQQEVAEQNTKLTTESEPAASSGSSSGGGSSASSCSCSSCCSSGSDSDSSDNEEDSASSSPKLHTEAVAKPLEQQQVTQLDKKLITESEPAASSGSTSSSSGSGSSASSCSCSSCSSSGSGSDSSDDEEDSASSRPKLHTEAVAKPLEQQQVTQLDKKLAEERPASSCSGSSSSSSGSGSDSSDDDEDSASSSPVTSDHPTEAAAKPSEQQQATEHDMKLNLAESEAPPATEIEMQEATEQDIGVEPKAPLEQQEATELNKKLTKERPASAGTEMKELIARAQEKKQQLRRRALERKRAREQLEEMERTARPVYEHIDPSVMEQLGISPMVEYMVSSEKSQDSERCLLQKLGLFLKST